MLTDEIIFFENKTKNNYLCRVKPLNNISNMKKFTMILGAVILGFMLASCGDNKKDTIIEKFNTFFDEETATLSQIDDADALVEYAHSFSERHDNLFTKLTEEFPLDDDENFVGMNQEDNDAVWGSYQDRFDALNEQFIEKGAAFFEPIIADLEDFITEDIFPLAEQYDVVPDDVIESLNDQLMQKFDMAEKYIDLCNDEQYDRYLDILSLFSDDEEEE